MVQENCLKKPKIVVIVGPTASGKTATSISLAKRFNGEIISADSMQIYKHMNIGTAKVTKTEMDGVPHHMIDIVQPTENYSVAMWVDETRKLISDIISRSKIPFVVGGTGLYVTSLLKGYTFHNVPENKDLRERYYKLYKEQGIEPLYNEIILKSPDMAKGLDKNKTKAVIRTLEIIHGEENKCRSDRGEEYDYLLIGLADDREKLYERINARVDRMIDDGLIDEFKDLIENHGLTKTCQSAGAIGYRELFPYIEGSSTLDETITLLKQHSRNYAKRQLTWMRKMDNIKWLTREDNIEKVVSDFLGDKK